MSLILFGVIASLKTRAGLREQPLHVLETDGSYIPGRALQPLTRYGIVPLAIERDFEVVACCKGSPRFAVHQFVNLLGVVSRNEKERLDTLL
jgi:hypothetical protein